MKPVEHEMRLLNEVPNHTQSRRKKKMDLIIFCDGNFVNKLLEFKSEVQHPPPPIANLLIKLNRSE